MALIHKYQGCTFETWSFGRSTNKQIDCKQIDDKGTFSFIPNEGSRLNVIFIGGEKGWFCRALLKTCHASMHQSETFTRRSETFLCGTSRISSQPGWGIRVQQGLVSMGIILIILTPVYERKKVHFQVFKFLFCFDLRPNVRRSTFFKGRQNFFFFFY